MAYMHLVFYINLLELWYRPPPEKNFRPGPIEHPKVAGERYEVKAILRYKSVKNKLQYKVKWLGWPTKDSIWELEGHLNYCEDILKEYWDQGLQSINRRKRSNTIVLSRPIKKAYSRL
jgi:hypothetical protein